MSMFSNNPIYTGGGTGGGLTPEQLANLVDDSELSAAEATVIYKVTSRADGTDAKVAVVAGDIAQVAADLTAAHDDIVYKVASRADGTDAKIANVSDQVTQAVVDLSTGIDAHSNVINTNIAELRTAVTSDAAATEALLVAKIDATKDAVDASDISIKEVVGNNATTILQQLSTFQDMVHMESQDNLFTLYNAINGGNSAASDQLLAATAALTALVQGVKGSIKGSVVQVVNDTGIAPAGTARASGILVPRASYGQQKFVLGGMSTANALSINKAFYIGASSAIQIYDYGTGVKTAGTSFGLYNPGKSVYATDTEVYTFGGSNGSAATTSCYKYIISTNALTAIRSLPAARYLPTVAPVGGSNVIVIGGATAPGATAASFTDTITRLNVVSNSLGTGEPVAPFKSFNGMTLALNPVVGSAVQWPTTLCLFPASCTSDDGTNYNTTPRGFIYDQIAKTCTLIDAGGACGPMYQRGDGKVFVFTGIGTGKILDVTAPAGSQWADATWTVPEGVSSMAYSYGNCTSVRGELLPMGIGAPGYWVAANYWTGNTPSDAGQSFYVVTN